MKATLVGFKAFSGKDGRKWVQLGVMFKDMQAVGGAFADSVLMSDQNDLSKSLKPGEVYDIDFDNKGHLLSIEVSN